MKPTRNRYRILLVALTCSLRALAHDVGLSTAVIQLQSTNVQATVSFAIRDMNALADIDADHDGLVTPQEFGDAQARIGQVMSAGCVVSNVAGRIEPTSVHCLLDPADNVEVQLVFPATKTGGGDISFPAIRELAAGHCMFVRLVGWSGETLVEKLVTRDSPPIALPVAAGTHGNAPEAPHTLTGFLLLGVEHIGTGYDHLLFLFGLLLVTRSLKSALAVITSFTLAHSITLAASTLNLVTLRPAITEPLIALSIVYVGVENLIRHGEPKHRWLLTFVFGLIHGFGFASVLRDLGVTSQSGVAGPLFSFNLGVEIGQLAVAALLLPVIWRLRRNETFRRRVVPGCCVLIVAAGGFWFWQRVWGG